MSSGWGSGGGMIANPIVFIPNPSAGFIVFSASPSIGVVIFTSVF
jgi:hypothetical protein